MHHSSLLKVLIGLFGIVAFAQAPPAVAPVVLTSVTRFAAIVVAEFEHVGATDCGDRSSRTCKLPAIVRVVRVLKNAGALKVVEHPFEVELPVYVRDPAGGEGNVWTNRRDIQDGQQYVFIALNPRSLADAVALPDDLEPITSRIGPRGGRGAYPQPTPGSYATGPNPREGNYVSVSTP